MDPATLNTQGGQQTTPTRTFRPVPSQILAPPATAVNPGVGSGSGEPYCRPSKVGLHYLVVVVGAGVGASDKPA